MLCLLPTLPMDEKHEKSCFNVNMEFIYSFFYYFSYDKLQIMDSLFYVPESLSFSFNYAHVIIFIKFFIYYITVLTLNFLFIIIKFLYSLWSKRFELELILKHY